MELWKKNLAVCWFGMLVSGIGLSQIAPVLPLYIKHLGVDDANLVAQYSGWAFGITFIVSAVFSPIWGSAADKYGRKPMLIRASLGMAIIIGSMGFAPNVYVLIGLRILQGVITGYGTACTTLIATQTSREHAGFALGILSTASITGSLLGPTIGGLIGDYIGLRDVFFVTGSLMFVSFVITALFIKEEFKREDKKSLPMKEIWRSIPEKGLTATLFLTLFMLSVALYSIEPVLTVFISQLSGDVEHAALTAGIVFSATGLANIISAPGLGRLADKIGAQKVMPVALVFAGLVFIPQIFVKSSWQLMVLRFLLGLASGGLNPCINALLKKITPDSLTGRVYGLNIAAGYLGVFAGSVLGGQIAAGLGVRYVFLSTGILMLLNALWVYLKVYRKMEKTGLEAS